MTCRHCKKESGGNLLPMFWYRLVHIGTSSEFCSRTCLVEHIAPELGKACVVKQWVPTEEEKERMAQ